MVEQNFLGAFIKLFLETTNGSRKKWLVKEASYREAQTHYAFGDIN